MENTKRMLGKRLKEIRVNRGYTQESLAEKAGVTANYLSRVEAGRCYPSLDCLVNIASILQLELRDLFDFSHLQEKSTETKNITTMIDGLDNDKKVMVAKIIKAISN